MKYALRHILEKNRKIIIFVCSNAVNVHLLTSAKKLALAQW
jgi:hypothetical protein